MLPEVKMEPEAPIPMETTETPTSLPNPINKFVSPGESRAGVMLNQYSIVAWRTTIFEKHGSPAQYIVVLPHKEL
jgi:hypothetical protein